MIQQLTLSEEVAVILNDAFQGDKKAEDTCVRYLAQVHDLEYDQLSEDELQEFILKEEDQLYYIFELYEAGEL